MAKESMKARERKRAATVCEICRKAESTERGR